MINVSGSMERSIADHERGCLVLIDAEQRKINPDNHIIAVLCDAVRLAREYGASTRHPARIAAAIDEAVAAADKKAREECAQIAKWHEICADFCCWGSRNGCADSIEIAIRATIPVLRGEKAEPPLADENGQCPNCANPPHQGPCKRVVCGEKAEEQR